MANPDDNSGKHISQAIYLDASATEALDYLKAHAQPGFRFSAAELFRTMLGELSSDPNRVLQVERHAGRGGERGRRIGVSLSPTDQDQLLALGEHYQKHAPHRHRVRDGVQKRRIFPLSRIFADFIVKKARDEGWDG